MEQAESMAEAAAAAGADERELDEGKRVKRPRRM